MQDSPDLKAAAQLYETILLLLRDADLQTAPVSLTPDQARAKMEMGLPLLHDLDLELDIEAIRELMLELSRAIETTDRKNQPHKRRLLWLQEAHKPDSDARRVRLALEDMRLDISALLPHIAAGESGPVTFVAQSLQLNPHLVWTLAQNALRPALHAWRRQLTPLAAGIQWQKGYCFICGTVAMLGELQGNNQVKHLRCGQCGADWLFSRLQCMYCGNEDHRTSSYLHTQGMREKMRLEVCDKCKGYLKVIAAFTPTPPEMLQVEDLATLHLDYIAQERGYARISNKAQ